MKYEFTMNTKFKIINNKTEAFEFEDIIYYFSENQITKTKKQTDIFLVENHKNDLKYIYKINHTKTKEEFDLITKTILLLNKNNFPTAKLITSKYEDSKSYFVFEFLKGNNIKKKEKYLKPISELLIKFYEITKKIDYNENLNFSKYVEKSNFKIENQLLNNIFKNKIEKLKNNKHKQLIINDVNTSNFIEDGEKLYLIDFDEIFFSEIELDLADFFTDYFSIQYKEEHNLFEIINVYKKYINYFTDYKINIEKIMDYMILILIKEITPNATKEENLLKLRCLKKYLISEKILIKKLS